MPILDRIPDSYMDLINNKIPCMCGTTKSNGLISVHPVSALWNDGKLSFSTRKEKGKYKNLVRDNRVTLCFLDPENPIRYIEVRGRAILTDDPDYTFLTKISKHHLGRDEYPFDPPGAQRATVTIDIKEVWIQNGVGG